METTGVTDGDTEQSAARFKPKPREDDGYEDLTLRRSQSLSYIADGAGVDGTGLVNASDDCLFDESAVRGTETALVRSMSTPHVDGTGCASGAEAELYAISSALSDDQLCDDGLHDLLGQHPKQRRRSRASKLDFSEVIDITSFMHVLRLHKYTAGLVKHRIDLHRLLHLREVELESAGVTAQGARARLMVAVEKFKKSQYCPAAWRAPPHVPTPTPAQAAPAPTPNTRPPLKQMQQQARPPVMYGSAGNGGAAALYTSLSASASLPTLPSPAVAQQQQQQQVHVRGWNLLEPR